MSELTIDDPAPGDEGDAARSRRRIAPLIVLAVAVAVGALFVVLASSDGGRNQTVESFLIDRPAPAVASTSLDDEPFDLSRRKGSWVVLNFFDPTCIPCQNEHPELVALDDQQSVIPDGAELYTIVNKGSDESVREYFDTNGGTWPVIRDPQGSISVAFGVAQVPETWIIDPNGIVRARFAGEITAEYVGTVLQQMREGLR